ncbi:hypothetical protein HMI55_000357 [Coelomomyces lativittatus]|nr:hypothetical protein HMI55_000357 [Coelomomyces lativittatus]
MVLYNALKPLPESIRQGESQLLLYESTFGYPLDEGPILEFSLTVKLPNSIKPEHFTMLDPYQYSGNSITYGPFKQEEDPSHRPLRIHFLSTKMGFTIESWHREIWVRNFGSTLEFEDRISLAHRGAKLKGPFSRGMFMQDMARQADLPYIAGMILELPASVEELYYRDDTGNVSTSAVHRMTDRTMLVLRPRYQVFGGWKYNWEHGFSMSSSSMLTQDKEATEPSVSRYTLTVPTLHSFDNNDVLAEHYQLKVVLPESAHLLSVALNQQPLLPPFDTSVSYYFFDTTGRLTIHLNQSFLYCAKPDLVTVQYTLPRFAFFQKPLAALTACVVGILSIMVIKKILFGKWN